MLFVKSHFLKTLFFITIFAFGFLVWYSPVIFKGSAPYKIKENLPIARSISETGLYSFEDSKNVFLASSLIENKGEKSLAGNKLTTYLYASVFNVFGVLSPDKLVLFSILLNSLTLLIFAFIVSKLFDFKITLLFSFIYILLPYNWLQIYSIGTYEFATFFLSLFFLFFLPACIPKFAAGLPAKNSIHDSVHYRVHEKILLILAGLFLVLSAMAREAFLLLIPILFVYLLYYKKKKEIVCLFTPIVLILLIFYLPGFLNKDSSNVYSKLFFSNKEKERSFDDFVVYSHLYPDPYTYHFERENYLENYNQQMEKVGFVESLKMKKVLGNIGERGVRFWERLMLGDILLLGHLGYFVSLEESGGPFVLFFALIGLFLFLKKKNKELFGFFVFWFLGTLVLLSYVALVSRTHMMDFSWAIPFLASLGVFYLIDRLDKNKVFSMFLVFTFLYSIVLANHVVFGKVYDEKPKTVKIENVSKSIDYIDDGDVIAIGMHTQDAILLNYLANKSVLVFKGGNIEKLLEENKLSEVFEEFRVKYVFGYSDELTEEIISATEVKNIETEEIKEAQTSFLKSFLMNLIR